MKTFLKTLFNEGATTCYTNSPHGYKVSSEPYDDDLFFCINELYSDRDNKPTKEWHNANVPRRADCNVTTFRNFLLELDDMPLNEQVLYVTSRVPVTSIVYSGGSSYHFIISLETPLPDYETYMSWSRRLHELVPAADPACKNPSRLSRLPDRFRLDTEKQQTLYFLGSRIANNTIEAILPPEQIIARRERSFDKVKQYVTPLVQHASFEPDQVMIERGIRGRNAFFFWLYNRFEELQMPREQRIIYVNRAYENLKDTSGFSISEAYHAARLGAH